MRVAYFINQYPKTSHTFIRREVAALERLGVTVDRVALRGWSAQVTDPEDLADQQRTHYVLHRGALPLLGLGLLEACRRPMRMLRAIRLAWSMARRSERAFPWHLMYLFEAFRLVRWMKAWGADHVHAHFGTNSTEVVMLARVLADMSYSFTAHGPEEFDKPEALGLTTMIAHAAFVVAISSFGRSQLCRWAPSEQWDKLKVVHCGLEPAFFSRAEDLTVAAVPCLVCVGRLCEQKGQLLLVAAVARLAREGLQIKLVLAGDGEMRSVIEESIRSHGIGDRVRITGWISSSQVREELLAARALVLPSFAEGLPVVIMEAMALGRPVISTFVAGIPELVRDGVEGWLVPAGDVDALAAAMRDCLQATPERLRQLGRAGHSRVMERHQVDTEATRLKGFFESAIAGRQP